MTLEKARDTIIQALNHHERRQIISILKYQPEGVRYTALLGETGLTTAKLNYQLNELHLLIEKNPEGQYTLTELGKRAASILDNINQNLEGDIELQPIVEDDNKERLEKTINRIFWGVMILYSLAPLSLTYVYFAYPDVNIPPWFLVLTYLLIGAFLLGMNYLRQVFPHLLYGLYEFVLQLFTGRRSQY